MNWLLAGLKNILSTLFWNFKLSIVFPNESKTLSSPFSSAMAIRLPLELTANVGRQSLIVSGRVNLDISPPEAFQIFIVPPSWAVITYSPFWLKFSLITKLLSTLKRLLSLIWKTNFWSVSVVWIWVDKSIKNGHFLSSWTCLPVSRAFVNASSSSLASNLLIATVLFPLIWLFKFWIIVLIVNPLSAIKAVDTEAHRRRLFLRFRLKLRWIKSVSTWLNWLLADLRSLYSSSMRGSAFQRKRDCFLLLHSWEAAVSRCWIIKISCSFLIQACSFSQPRTKKSCAGSTYGSPASWPLTSNRASSNWPTTNFTRSFSSELEYTNSCSGTRRRATPPPSIVTIRSITRCIVAWWIASSASYSFVARRVKAPATPPSASQSLKRRVRSVLRSSCHRLYRLT